MELWDHKLKIYVGRMDLYKMDREIRRGFYVFCAQKVRMGVKYSSREFMYWYYFHPVRKKLINPQVGRKDHAKVYSFDNIHFEERTSNLQERNARCGYPGRTSKKVRVTLPNGKKETFNRIKDAAEKYKVDIKTIYNRCTGRTKDVGHSPLKGIKFSWAK